jgi:hypothetical protein
MHREKGARSRRSRLSSITLTLLRSRPVSREDGPALTGRSSRALFRMYWSLLATAALLLSNLLGADPPQKPDRPNEDWNCIYLSKGELEAREPLVGETDEELTFTRQLVKLEWRPGDPIYLFTMIPKPVAKPPVILYLYTYPTETDRFLNERFCQQLTKNGFAAVGFASALTGHRYHDRPMKQWFVSELQESLGSTTHDVQMILDYLATRSDLDMTRVGMFGEGSGGAIAVLAAAADRRIRAIDLLNPWGDWPNWLAKSSVVPETERALFMKPEFLRSVANLDPVRWLPGLKIPIRLQYMNEGQTVPVDARARIEAAVPPQTLKVPSERALREYQRSSGANFLDWIHDQLLAIPERPIVSTRF